MAYLSNFLLFKAMSSSDSIDTKFKSKMPGRTTPLSRTQPDFFGPIVKAAYNDAIAHSNSSSPTSEAVNAAFGSMSMSGVDKAAMTNDADFLKAQIEELRSKFAKEHAIFDLLLTPQEASDACLEELDQQVEEQKARVAALKQNLSSVKDQLAELEVLDNGSESGMSACLSELEGDISEIQQQSQVDMDKLFRISPKAELLPRQEDQPFLGSSASEETPEQEVQPFLGSSAIGTPEHKDQSFLGSSASEDTPEPEVQSFLGASDPEDTPEHVVQSFLGSSTPEKVSDHEEQSFLGASDPEDTPEPVAQSFLGSSAIEGAPELEQQSFLDSLSPHEVSEHEDQSFLASSVAEEICESGELVSPVQLHLSITDTPGQVELDQLKESSLQQEQEALSLRGSLSNLEQDRNYLKTQLALEAYCAAGLSVRLRDSEARLAEREEEMDHLRADYNEMACSQDLLLDRCIEAASTQQVLDQQAEELDTQRKRMLVSCAMLEASFDALRAQQLLLDTAERDLLDKQDDVCNQATQLLDFQERLAQDEAKLETAARLLSHREAQVISNEAALRNSIPRLATPSLQPHKQQGHTHANSSDSRRSSGENVQQMSPLVGQHPAQQTPAQRTPKLKKQLQELFDRQSNTRAERGMGGSWEHAQASMAALEHRQRDLDMQKAGLQARHKELTADLTSKQTGLNNQWAALDIDQSRAEACAQALQAQTEDIQVQWQILEEEWCMLEAQKRAHADTVHSAERAGTVSPPRPGVAESAAEQTTEESCFSDGGSATWSESQISDNHAVEWAIVNAEKERLKAQTEVLRKREEAVAEAQAQFSAIGNPLFSFPLDVPSIEATSIFDRGDSPRDLQEPCKTTQVSSSSEQKWRPSYASTDGDVSTPKLLSIDSSSSAAGLNIIKERAQQLRHERTRLWAAVTDPEDVSRRLQRIREMEQLQSKREMMLEAREAVDTVQLGEMNMSRSLALDQREKIMQQREEAQKEAHAKAHSRDLVIHEMRRKITALETELQEATSAEYLSARHRSLGSLPRKHRPWAKPVQRGSLLDKMLHQDMDVDEVYNSASSLTFSQQSIDVEEVYRSAESIGKEADAVPASA